jgi:hypothetical protein
MGLALTAGAACRDAPAPPQATETPMKTLQEVTDAEWATLAATRVYLGHQSVGGNILDGLQRLLAENPRIPLRVVESDSLSAVAAGTLVHNRIGTNGDPAGKARDFSGRLANGLGPGGGIAMFKLCYVDFKPTTDVAAVFRAYQENVERVRASHPEVRIVHLTTPLTVRKERFKDFIRGILRKPRYSDADAARHEYNRLLQAEYGGRDPVFDLARVEATRPDGTLESYRYREASVLNLAPEFSRDGAHLNEAGSRRVGEAFLVFLASVAAAPPAN